VGLRVTILGRSVSCCRFACLVVVQLVLWGVFCFLIILELKCNVSVGAGLFGFRVVRMNWLW